MPAEEGRGWEGSGEEGGGGGGCLPTLPAECRVTHVV